MEKCRACGIYPLTTNGMVYCGGCKITAPSLAVWDKAMGPKKGTNVAQLLESLRDPLVSLNAIAEFSDDPGIKRMAVASLTRINALDIGPFFNEPEAAAKAEKLLKDLLKETKKK